MISHARRWHASVFLVLALFLSACGGAAVQTGQGELTTAPTATVAATAAVSSSPTAAPSSASAVSSSPTAAATPAAASTVPASAAPTVAPSATVAAAPPSRTAAQPTPTRAAASRPSPSPSGAVPAGWKVYTSRYLPIAIAYPPDWTFDDSGFKEGRWRVDFVAPRGTPGDPFVIVTSSGIPSRDPNIDVQRDRFAQQVTEACAKSGVENTRNTTVSNITFATVTATCDRGNGSELEIFDLSAGLFNNVYWTLQARSTLSQLNANGTQYFLPMLQSLNIYANPPGVPPGGVRADLSIIATGERNGRRSTFDPANGGTYRLAALTPDSVVEGYLPSRAGLRFADFSMSTDVQQIDGPANAGDTVYAGVLFRAQPQAESTAAGSRYWFYISQDGSYGLQLIQPDGTRQTLIAPRVSTAIRVQRGAVNRLTVTCQGDTIALQVNGTDLATHPATIITAGVIGFQIQTSPAAQSAEYGFSNVQISEVP